MQNPMRLIALLVLVLILILTGILITVIAGHAQTTGVIVTPGKGLTFVYPGVGQSPTVIVPPTGAPSYYYRPAPMMQPVPMVPTVPTLPSVYTPAPAMSLGGF